MSEYRLLKKIFIEVHFAIGKMGEFARRERKRKAGLNYSRKV